MNIDLQKIINSVMADEFPYNGASFAKRSGVVYVAENRQ